MPLESDLELYSVLGLKPGAPLGDVKAQYRKMARQFHPDRNQGDAWCEEQLRKINAAYEILNDPARKADYDRRHSAPPPRPDPQPQPPPRQPEPPPQARQPDPPKPPPAQDYPRPNPSDGGGVWDYAVRPAERRRPSTVSVLVSAILVLVIIAFALDSVREYYSAYRTPLNVAIFGDGDAPVGPAHNAPAAASVAPVPSAPVVAQDASGSAPPPQAFVMRTKAGGGAPPNLEPFRAR